LKRGPFFKVNLNHFCCTPARGYHMLVNPKNSPR
jgi:hypothetical protein